MQSLLGSIIFWRLLSRGEGIRCALYIEDQGGTSKHPLGRGMLSFELCGKHIGLISVGSHVAGALVDTLVNLVVYDELGLAVDQGHHGELLFRDGLIHERGVLIPSCTF